MSLYFPAGKGWLCALEDLFTPATQHMVSLNGFQSSLDQCQGSREETLKALAQHAEIALGFWHDMLSPRF